jgi:predicted DNA-binding transcriptional regulator YafY
VLYTGAGLVEQVWGQVYQDAVTAVIAKLDNVLPDELRRQVMQSQQSLVVSGLTARDYRPWVPTLQTLRACIQTRHSVRLTYRSFNLEETCRDVDPYALTFRWGFWYMVGYCRLRQEMRTFRVDRIGDATRLPSKYQLPDQFSAKEYVEQTMRFEDRYKIVVHFDARSAPYVRERMGHWTELLDHEDGSITLHMKVSDLDWATGWVLSHGAAAQALEPEELVTRIRDEARHILEHYTSPS